MGDRTTKPPVTPGVDYFVGRSELIQKVRVSLSQIGVLYIGDAHGPLDGIGKTTLLAKLYEHVLTLPDCYPAWVSMADFDPGRNGKRAELRYESSFTWTCNLDEYRRLLTTLALGLPAEHFADFTGTVKQLSDDAFRSLADRRPQDQDLYVAIGQLRDRITQEFVRRVNTLGQTQRVVLFVDDFHTTMDQQVGEWLLRLVSQLQNSLVVLARRGLPGELPGSQDRVLSLPLDSFSEQETLEYLRKRLHSSVLPPGLFDNVLQFSGGHPQAVALAADLASQQGLDDPSLSNVLRDMPTNQWEQVRILVDGILATVNDEDILRALEVGSVLRHFDGELLCQLMARTTEEAKDLASAQFQSILNKLEDYSFTERDAEGYKFHEFIRSGITRRLDPTVVERLHRQAASIYADRLVAVNEGPSKARYPGMYRYEDPRWQAMVSEWLYHLASTSDGTNAGLALADVYFHAFWWWGRYLEFPLCERLLAEARPTSTPSEDPGWLGALRKFHGSYPPGYARYERRATGNWSQVALALNRLRQIGGIGDAIPGVAEGNRHYLRAVTDIFLAETWRYRAARDVEAAARLYCEADELFSQTNDLWSMSWIEFHLADLYLEANDLDRAVDYCQRSLARARERGMQDSEVIANDYRVLGDVCWQRGEVHNAFCNYARAVLSSYAFQGMPPPPDVYTQAFYREITDRTFVRLRSLCDADRQEALWACGYLHDFWTPYWELAGESPAATSFDTLLSQNRVEELKSVLFPPAPCDDEREVLDSDYVYCVASVVAEKRRDMEASGPSAQKLDSGRGQTIVELVPTLEALERKVAGPPEVAPAEKFAFLSSDTMNDLIDAVLSARLATVDGRDSLLRGIHEGFVANLPRRDSDLAQIKSDLGELNKVQSLEGGQIPLKTWLENAVAECGLAGRVEQERFQQALDQVKEESTSRPPH